MQVLRRSHGFASPRGRRRPDARPQLLNGASSRRRPRFAGNAAM